MKQRESPSPRLPHDLPTMWTHPVMTPRSGLIYIIINKKTGLVLDDPVDEGGFVTVNHLNENDTQKA